MEGEWATVFIQRLKPGQGVWPLPMGADERVLVRYDAAGGLVAYQTRLTIHDDEATVRLEFING